MKASPKTKKPTDVFTCTMHGAFKLLVFLHHRAFAGLFVCLFFFEILMPGNGPGGERMGTAETG